MCCPQLWRSSVPQLATNTAYGGLLLSRMMARSVVCVGSELGPWAVAVTRMVRSAIGVALEPKALNVSDDDEALMNIDLAVTPARAATDAPPDAKRETAAS